MKKSKDMSSNLILGKKTKIPYNTPSDQGNNNVVIVGSSGMGKSSCFVIPNIMQGGANIVISDPKGSILNAYGKQLSEIYDIYFLNLKDLKNSMNYNPLKYVKNEEDIAFIVSIITDNLSNGEKAGKGIDAYWYNAKKALITALIAFVCKYEAPETANMSTVIDMLTKLQPRDDESDADYFNEIDQVFLDTKDPFIVSNYNVFCNNSKRTAACILSEASSCLRDWAQADIRELTRYDESNFYQFVLNNPETNKNGKYKALFVIADDVSGEKNFLSTMFYAQIMQMALMVADSNSSNQLETPLRFYLDDFATVGKLPDLETYIANIRSRNISVALILQNESQLIDIYGVSKARTIIGNCNYYVYMGSTDNYCKQEMVSRFSELRKNDIYSLKQTDCLIDNGINQFKDEKGYKQYENEHGNFCENYFLNQTRPERMYNSFETEKYLQEENIFEVDEKQRKLQPVYVRKIRQSKIEEQKVIAISLQRAASKYAKYDPDSYKTPLEQKKAWEEHISYVDALKNLRKEAEDIENNYVLDLIKFTCTRYDIDLNKKNFNIDLNLKNIMVDFPVLQEEISLKEWWDSYSESKFYENLMAQVREWNKNEEQKIGIETHVHLSEIFQLDDWCKYKGSDKFKLQNMHCDFIIRTVEHGQILAGIEVDGPHHQKEEQVQNDLFKDELFFKCGIPLWRISAENAREGETFSLEDKMKETKINEIEDEELSFDVSLDIDEINEILTEMLDDGEDDFLNLDCFEALNEDFSQIEDENQ